MQKGQTVCQQQRVVAEAGVAGVGVPAVDFVLGVVLEGVQGHRVLQRARVAAVAVLGARRQLRDVQVALVQEAKAGGGYLAVAGGEDLHFPRIFLFRDCCKLHTVRVQKFS